MRLLFVYQDHAEAARRLLEEMSVRDVKVVFARKNATSPTLDEIADFQRGSTTAAACGVVRKYLKAIPPNVNVVYVAKKFRFEDQQLREWLAPRDRVPGVILKPSDAFRVAERRSSRLILHPNALQHADEIDKIRWEFTTLAADLLARDAAGDAKIGSCREWNSRHGIDFAANGQITYVCTLDVHGDTCTLRTQWHLKAGDKTTASRAARVYFGHVDSEIYGRFTVVFYVGPHPRDGTYSLDMAVPKIDESTRRASADGCPLGTGKCSAAG